MMATAMFSFFDAPPGGHEEWVELKMAQKYQMPRIGSAAPFNARDAKFAKFAKFAKP